MKHIVEYGSIALFVAVFFLTDKNIYPATAALMASYTLGLLFLWFKDKKLTKTHIAMWLFLMVFGGLTLYLQDDRFIKWKPTIANWVIGLAFLTSPYFAEKSIIQKMLGDSVKMEDKKWKSLNLMWVAFFFVSGLANIYVALNYPLDLWVKFKFIGLMGMTFVFSILQGIWLYKNADFIDDESESTETSDPTAPSTRMEIIQERLSQRFPGAQIDLEDESHLHAGHAGAKDGRGHYRLHILSDEFKELSRLKRHQLVYACLGELMQSDIHALAITAEVADEIF